MKLLVCYRHPTEKEIFIDKIIEVAEPCIVAIINRLVDALDKTSNYNDYEKSFLWEKEMLRSYLVGFLNKNFYDIYQVGVIFEPARDPKYVSEQLILVDYINDKGYKVKKKGRK